MAKLIFDDTGKKFFESGVSHAVLHVYDNELKTYGEGVAWNGVQEINEQPSGAEAEPIYADNIKYANIVSNEDFGASITAYTYPDEFAECDGSAELYTGVFLGQQDRKTFGLTYETKVGNDTEGLSAGVKYHIVYGCTASPSEKNYSTINESPEAISFSWELKTTPIPVEGYKPTATITIDSRKCSTEQITALEKLLYGDDSVGTSKLPMPADLKTIFDPKV